MPRRPRPGGKTRTPMTRTAPLGTALLLALGLATAAAAQVRLEAKFVPGKRTLTTTTTVNQTLTIAGMDIPTSGEAVVIASRQVSAPNAEGEIRMLEKTEAIRQKLTLPGGLQFDFDSANPNAPPANAALEPLAAMYRALVGSSYTLVLDKDRKVRAAEGLDDLLARAGPAADSLRADLNVKRLASDHAVALARLPDGPVNMGDRWEREEVLGVGSGQMLTFKAFYEYRGTVEQDGRTLDRIGMHIESVRFTIAEDAPIPVRAKSSDLRIESSSGTLLFDRERGEMVDTRSAMRIVGSLLLDVMGNELPGKLDLTMETRSVTRFE
jgi:hypothetical protein